METIKSQLVKALLDNGFKQKNFYFEKSVNRKEITFQLDEKNNKYIKTYREYPLKEGYYFKRGRLTKKILKELINSMAWER
jgi:hypothetical protein